MVPGPLSLQLRIRRAVNMEFVFPPLDTDTTLSPRNSIWIIENDRPKTPEIVRCCSQNTELIYSGNLKTRQTEEQSAFRLIKTHLSTYYGIQWGIMGLGGISWRLCQGDIPIIDGSFLFLGPEGYVINTCSVLMVLAWSSVRDDVTNGCRGTCFRLLGLSHGSLVLWRSKLLQTAENKPASI